MHKAEKQNNNKQFRNDPEDHKQNTRDRNIKKIGSAAQDHDRFALTLRAKLIMCYFQHNIFIIEVYAVALYFNPVGFQMHILQTPDRT